MTFLKKLGCAAAIALAASSAQAGVMNKWTFDTDGSGSLAPRLINEYLDVNGNAFINITETSGSSFKFSEFGAFNILQADSNGRAFRTNITATLQAYGTGNFSGGFTFTGGIIKMYQNPVDEQYATTEGMYGANLGNLIGTFNVLAGGGGMVDASGNPTGNGQVSIFAKAAKGALAAGYFFADNGVDMSTIETNAFAFTNANTVGEPTPEMISELACEFAGFKGDGCGSGTYTNVAGEHFFVGNNGQFKFNDVPEPGSVALFGIALFGIGALRRRVK